jgi:GH15 family glucan-1,4-alpha-glucosidase
MTATTLPHIPGVLTADEVVATAGAIAALQLPNGMIPWNDGGHCDPWNHVETAIALDIAGLHDEAAHAYRWLVQTQRPDGSWFNYYRSDGSVEDAKLDTNVCAYIAAGVWHHWLCTADRAFVDELWPAVRRALDWVLTLQTPRGTILWARETDSMPWDYALLTGSSSIWHALECGVDIARLVGETQPRWATSAAALRRAIVDRPEWFEPKERWAMDWYYPVLTGALIGAPAKARLAESWDTFAMEGKGIRCVSDQPWVTAAETAECALAYAAIGDLTTASDLLRWTRAHRADDGSYWTGIVYPDRENFPDGEHTAYTGAAVILAADAISGASPAAHLFVHDPIDDDD